MAFVQQSQKIGAVSSSIDAGETNFWDMNEDDMTVAPTLEEAEHTALVDRILGIMRSTYERLQVALVIPIVLTYRHEVADQFISSCDKETLFGLCDKYLHRGNTITLDETGCGIFIDHELIKAINLLHSNEKFLKNIDHLVKCLPESSKNFLSAINDLKSLTQIRLKTTAEKEIQKEKMLHHIFHDNEKLQEKIEEMKTQINERDICMQWKIAEKQVLIQKYKKDLATKKWNNHILIRNEVTAANEQMTQIYAKSESKQQELQEETEKAKQSYEKLLQENIQADMALREKKARILAQLKGWIKKYDNDIGERTHEIERLEAELNGKTDEYTQFMEQYEKQENEFNTLVTMRDAEEKKIQEEKMLLFMMNRAARLIQTRWRMFRQKKKKPKGKGRKAKK